MDRTRRTRLASIEKSMERICVCGVGVCVRVCGVGVYVCMCVILYVNKAEVMKHRNACRPKTSMQTGHLITSHRFKNPLR